MLLFSSSSFTHAGPPIQGDRFFMVVLLLSIALSLPVACTNSEDSSHSVRTSAPAKSSGHRATPTPAENKLIAELEAADIAPCRTLLPRQQGAVTSDMVTTVRVAVDALGVVQNVRILTSTYPHKRFEACLLRTIKAIHLSPPEKALSVDAGFVLKQ